MEIINDLKSIDNVGYIECLDYIVLKLAECKFVRSVYQFGAINDPGISDIDLIVILNGDIHDKVECYDFVYAIIKDAPNSTYCFWHNPIVITTDEVKYLRTFHTVDNLNLLYGECFDENHMYYHFGSKLNCYWNVFFVEIAMKILSRDKVSLRLLLLVNNNLLFSVKSNDKIFQTDFAADLQEKGKYIRKNILTHENKNQLAENSLVLLIESLRILEKQERLSSVSFRMHFIVSPQFIYFAFPGSSLRFFWGKWLSRNKGIIILGAHYFEARSTIQDVVYRLQEEKGKDYIACLFDRLTVPKAFGVSW